MRETQKWLRMEEGLEMGFKEVEKKVRIKSSNDSSSVLYFMVCFR